MRVLLLCLSCLLASVNGLYEEFFQIDFKALMKDETLMKTLFDCFMGRKSCENFQNIKDTAQLLFYNKCEGCTAEQKEIFEKTLHNLAQIYPKEYAEFTQPSPLANLRGQQGSFDKETEELFNIDFTMLLTNKNHSKALVNCLVDRGPCDQFKLYKAMVPKLMFNQCKGCRPEHKEVFDWTIGLMTKLYPEEMAVLTKSLEENPPGLTASQEELFNMNFTKIIDDKNELHALVDCLMDRGPCEKYKLFKTAGIKLLKNNCTACTPEQKKRVEEFIIQFVQKYPKGYAEILYKINNPEEIGEYDEFFKLDFNTFMADSKEMKTIFQCLMDKGPCDKHKTIKDFLPKVLTTKCKKCKPEQVKVYEDLQQNLKKHYPKEYEELAKMLSLTH